MIMGLQHANYVVFPISPRNLAPAVAHLHHEVGVEHVLVGRDTSTQDLSHKALDILGSQCPSADLPQLSPTPVFEDLFLLDWTAHTTSDDLPLLSRNHRLSMSCLLLKLHPTNFNGLYLTGLCILDSYECPVGEVTKPGPEDQY